LIVKHLFTYGLWHDATQRTSRCCRGLRPWRGIARALAEAGAAVYCTGRSTRDNPSPYKRPETIEETAEMIATAGGRSVAIRVADTLESEVQALFVRVDKEHGRLDVLVNSVAGEDSRMHQWGSFWNTHLKNGRGQHIPFPKMLDCIGTGRADPKSACNLTIQLSML
jgi:NAD(P)-dependent dehydrogenase (short-subunit alcohol dehydrogenase family)